jgi:hypothetical protein
VLTGAEAWLAAAVAALGQVTGKVSAVLAAFEPEGTAAAEELDARLEAAAGGSVSLPGVSPRMRPSTPWDL